MVRVLTVDDIKSLIHKVTLDTLFKRLIEKLENNFSHWQEFEKIPRITSHFVSGVIELMPFWGKDYYAMKYVTGHPANPQQHKMTVVGLGLLADVATGYPVLISEMTLLTAIRTAATSALAAKFLAKSTTKTFAIIGTGAQSEFQVLAHHALFNLKTVKYFDLDDNALDKFAKNLLHYPFELIRCRSAEEALENADIITTATAGKKQVRLLQQSWIKPGLLINAIGGDCSGKTELDPQILSHAKVVVDYLDQAKHEGEIQNNPSGQVYAELWELVARRKKGRERDDEVFVFDSVGIALEDYTILKLVYSLAEDFHVGHVLDLIPEISDAKNLFKT